MGERKDGAWPQPIETWNGEPGDHVLIWSPNEWDIGWWAEREDDQPQQPGANPGWYSYTGRSYPGRSREHGFGGSDDWISPPQGQPTHWMPMPSAPPSHSQEGSDDG